MADNEDLPAPETADGWLEEIDRALEREKKWRERGDKIVKRYRDERTAKSSTKQDSKVNILWSNTEVLKAALYPSTAKPDVRRRFPDTPETTVLSRTAAEVVERSLSYAIDVEDVDDPIESAIEDDLLPGRGVCWVSYEPSLGKDDYGVETVNGQNLCLDFVYWKDFCHGKSRGWKGVPWVGRRHGMRPDKFKEKFPNAKPAVPNRDYSLTEGKGQSEPDDIEVWEIWSKARKQRLYVARGYLDILAPTDDPYGLTGFFPCPKPLYSVTTTDGLIPEPEFCQYQDQAGELDRISTRITRLTEQLKWKGIYDSSMDDSESTLQNLASADDNEFLPYANWMALKDKGGIESGVGFWPMERIIGVLKELHIQRAQLIQTIYEITGISDIIRGSSDPRETKGAQQLKAQFGSMRMQARQKEVQRFIRDCYRLMAEIIAEHFTVETLEGITGMSLPAEKPMQLPATVPPPMPSMPMPAQMGQAPPNSPPMGTGGGEGGAMNPALSDSAPNMPEVAPTPAMQAAPKPSWPEVMEILRSDRLRSYRIDIETDQTAFQDSEEEKSKRIEFMTAVNEMLEKAYLAATNAPTMLPLIRETFMFAIRSFKAGRTLEQAAEDAFDQLIRNPPPAKPDPRAAEVKAKMEQESATFELNRKDKAERLMMDQDDMAQRREADLSHEARKLDMQAAAKPLALPAPEPDPTMPSEREKFDFERSLKEREFNLKRAAQNKQIATEAEGEMGQPKEIDAQSPLEMLIAGVAQLAGSIADSNRQLAEQIAAGQAQIAQGQAQQSEQFAQLAQLIAAPRNVDLKRGRDGKATGATSSISLN
jgi:hypothetical protein